MILILDKSVNQSRPFFSLDAYFSASLEYAIDKEKNVFSLYFFESKNQTKHSAIDKLTETYKKKEKEKVCYTFAKQLLSIYSPHAE